MLIPLTDYRTGEPMLVETTAIEHVKQLRPVVWEDEHGRFHEHPQRTWVETLSNRLVVRESVAEINAKIEHGREAEQQEHAKKQTTNPKGTK